MQITSRIRRLFLISKNTTSGYISGRFLGLHCFKTLVLLELVWAKVIESGMQSLWIVEPFDVITRGARRVLVRLIFIVVNLFDFERFEEAFHRRIVVTTPSTAHALPKAAAFKSSPELLTCELRSSIRMNDYSGIRFSQRNRLVERIDRE